MPDEPHPGLGQGVQSVKGTAERVHDSTVLRDRAGVLLSGGWEVRLPSEDEWEKAVRGGLEVPDPPVVCPVEETGLDGKPPPPAVAGNDLSGRRYPWGETFDPDRASVRGADLGQRGPVGCFPGGQSPTGCEEMVGTVWEWTCSLRGGYPYPEGPEERAEREDPRAGGLRVLRGGGFADKAVDARCAARGGDLPHHRDGGIGFRLLLSPSSPGLSSL